LSVTFPAATVGAEMDTYMVVLRIVHILAGVFWVGAALTVILFIQPTAKEVGPAAGPFMSHLAGSKRLVDFVLGAGGLTVLAGLLMYWRVSGGLEPDWIGSTYGITLTVGALCAIAALAIGGSVVRPGIMATLAIGREVAASGGPPTPEQAAQLQALQRRSHAAGKVIVPLLILAVAAMASARYL
jgi:hypothetical protein